MYLDDDNVAVIMRSAISQKWRMNDVSEDVGLWCMATFYLLFPLWHPFTSSQHQNVNLYLLLPCCPHLPAIPMLCQHLTAIPMLCQHLPAITAYFVLTKRRLLVVHLDRPFFYEKNQLILHNPLKWNTLLQRFIAKF